MIGVCRGISPFTAKRRLMTWPLAVWDIIRRFYHHCSLAHQRSSIWAAAGWSEVLRFYPGCGHARDWDAKCACDTQSELSRIATRLALQQLDVHVAEAEIELPRQVRASQPARFSLLAEPCAEMGRRWGRRWRRRIIPDRIIQDCFGQIRLGEIGISEIGLGQVRPVESGALNDAFGEVGTGESGRGEVGASQIGHRPWISQTQAEDSEFGVAEVRGDKARTWGLYTLQVGLIEDRTGTICVGQIGFAKTCAEKPCPAEIDSTEVLMPEVNFAQIRDGLALLTSAIPLFYPLGAALEESLGFVEVHGCDLR